MTNTDIFRLFIPIVIIVTSIAIRKKPRFQGIFFRWWVLLLFGIGFLAFRIYEIFFSTNSI